jgi:hypothetical protein
MSKRKFRDINSKPAYEPPKILKLDITRDSLGDCGSGSGDTGNCADYGNTASLDCNPNGNSPASWCNANGSSAHVQCISDGSGVV